MYFAEIITLRSVSTTYDGNGYPVESYIYTEIYAEVKSVTRSEMTLANARGREATKIFVVRSEDWDGQTKVIHGLKTYDIIRDYDKGKGTVELVCSDKAV